MRDCEDIKVTQISSLGSKMDILLSTEKEDSGGETVLGDGVKQRGSRKNSSILPKLSVKLETSKWKYALGSGCPGLELG